MEWATPPLVNFPDPPPADVAAKRVREAFADWPQPEGPFCDQCFTPDAEKAILAAVADPDAPAKAIRPVFYEHIACSIGADHYFRLFPRALETLFLEYDIYPDLTQTAISCGLYRLSEDRQTPLREAAARGALGFFAEGKPAPLGGGVGSRYFAAEQGGMIIRLLLALCVEPRQIFGQLLAIGGAQVWDTFADALDEPDWFGNDLVRQGGAGVTDLLDALATVDFFDTVTIDVFDRGIGHLDPKGGRSHRPRAAHKNYLDKLEKAARHRRAALVSKLDRALEAIADG